jgi:NAD(P)H dehydrogenase (quinone)
LASITDRPTGPELLDPHQLTEVYAKVLGRPVKYQPFSERMFFKALKAMGMERHFMAQARHYFEEYRRGAFEVGATNDVVLEVGGSEPEDFETITRRYVAANPMARPSLVNKGRALVDFMKILLARTPNLDAYERSQNQPILRAPKYGLDNEQWLAPHSKEAAYGPNSAFNEGHLQSRLETDRKLPEHPSVKPLREREVDSAIGNVR